MVFPGTFNSRPHKEVDTAPKIPAHSVENFQFTTSQGGRHDPLRFPATRSPLSIHDLTRRSTYNFGRIILWAKLSIHDLTRRSTPAGLSRTTRQKLFQFTTSQGGRPESNRAQAYNPRLSIHDLTRRST